MKQNKAPARRESSERRTTKQPPTRPKPLAADATNSGPAPANPALNLSDLLAAIRKSRRFTGLLIDKLPLATKDGTVRVHEHLAADLLEKWEAQNKGGAV